MPGPSSCTDTCAFLSPVDLPPIVTRPPFRPYLIAFSTRLKSTCCNRSTSARATNVAGTWFSTVTFFSTARDCRSSITRSTSSPMFTGCKFITICPLSSREMVSRSSIRYVSRSVCFSIVFKNRVDSSGSFFAPSSSVSTNPLINESGVRNSWLTFATNSCRVFSNCFSRVRS